MILYPAIDILGGKAVRLTRGDFAEQTVYDDDPLEAARAWATGGAQRLHVVDLDGAREGQPVNLNQLQRIAQTLDVPVQYGGGLRSLPALRDALAAGAERLILGTAALTDPDFLDAALAAHAERLLVSVDVRGGRVATAGWTHTTSLSPVEVIDELQGKGVRGFIYTDVDHDGTLDGPDLERLATVAGAVQGSLLYSGGIGELAHLEQLAELGRRDRSLAGVIVGKALYERRFTVAEGQAALGGPAERLA